jgi:hypothetical protein
MEEDGASETSVKTYGAKYFRNQKKQNQNSLFALWFVLNSNSIMKFYLQKFRRKQVMNTQTGLEGGCMAVNMYANERSKFLGFTLKLQKLFVRGTDVN